MNNATQRGLTLIEASIVLAIVAIVATSAVAGFGGMRERLRVKGVTAELASDLQFVRSEAVTRNRSVRISFSTMADGASCYVIHTGPPSACRCGAAGAAAECTGVAQAIKAVRVPVGVVVDLQNKKDSMLYDPVRGTTSPAATIDIKSPQRAGLRNIVNILGRVQTCSPIGGLSGYRPC